MSADFTYDLNKWVTVGAKYGFRFGEVALSSTSKDFVSSKAHLGIIRADLHIVKKWDALAEFRYLGTPTAEDSRIGALVGIYRHIGNHAKIGAGYSFSDFSDDLTDQSYESDELFFNIIGKF